MPQLMPLKWIFFEMVLFLFLIGVCMMYSEEMNMHLVKNNLIGKMDNNYLWSW